MTCIVGLIHNKDVYIGGDSAASGGQNIRIRKDNKVFKNGNILYGFTTSFRMGQILAYQFDTPKRPPKESIRDYIYGLYIEAVRGCLKDHGYAKVESNVEQGGNFIIGYEGLLFEIQDDFHVAEYHEPYTAIGAGESYALGALRILNTSEMNPKQIITKSLEVATHFTPCVRPPFIIKKLSYKETL